jgi:hypothetical protein
MVDLLTSGLPLAAEGLLAAKKTPVSGMTMGIFIGFVSILAVVLGYFALKRRR